jgi:sulfatase-like protein
MHQRPVRSFGQGAMFTAHSISSGSPTMEICRSMLTAAGLLAFSSISGLAQQATGVPASPEATTTITGKQLPPPDPAFGGVIKEKASESKPWWPPRVVPPKGAPNVLLIMTDDQGFGAPSTFGGVIPTPSMDRIAKTGLRYTNFHSTSLCSPTRAAIITGRNHHSVGFGVVGEVSTGLPGLRLHHPNRERHHRYNSQGERLRHLVVRQGSQHAVIPVESGRAVRTMAQWHGF